MGSEVDIYQDIVDFVNDCGHFPYGNPVGNRGYYKFGKKGQFDISGALRPTGRRLEIEVKSPGKDLRKDQIDWYGNMISRGVFAIVVESLDDVVKAFEKEGLCRI